MKILITGAAGFIGYFLARKLIGKNINVYGIDSLNDYYDVNLKKSRLQNCGLCTIQNGKECFSTLYPNYIFKSVNLCNKTELENIFRHFRFDCVINLAAQAGVRYSLIDPDSYMRNNIEGFVNLIEACRKFECSRLIYASSSSVYGNSTQVPFQETASTDRPVSIYAATKKSNELMAYSYSVLYGIETIGLRFFSVYGPYGRPDMAPMLFARAIHKNETIKIFNHGNLARDFTYIDDIAEGITKIITTPRIKTDSRVPAFIYNIGHGSPVNLLDFVHILEKCFGKTVKKEFVNMQPGDVHQTWADTTRFKEDYGYHASTPLETGIERFASWYNDYYRENKN